MSLNDDISISTKMQLLEKMNNEKLEKQNVIIYELEQIQNTKNIKQQKQMISSFLEQHQQKPIIPPITQSSSNLPDTATSMMTFSGDNKQQLLDEKSKEIQLLQQQIQLLQQSSLEQTYKSSLLQPQNIYQPSQQPSLFAHQSLVQPQTIGNQSLQQSSLLQLQQAQQSLLLQQQQQQLPYIYHPQQQQPQGNVNNNNNSNDTYKYMEMMCFLNFLRH